jgi:pimeloyl-ACP methyl ester carboxylesterase
VEQRITFCTGAEGRSIACAVAGNGPPLVRSAWWASHLQYEWEHARFRQFLESLAQRHTLVRYDRVGVGLSDRTSAECTLASEVANLEAVVRHHGLERFALFGTSLGVPTAIAFAALHPEQVSQLVLYGGFASGSRLAKPEVRSALLALVRASWGLGAKALADIFAPDLSAEDAKELVGYSKAACSAETAARLLELMYQVDVESSAREVRVPTLVMHRRKDRAIPFESARQLAALIPSAQLVTFEGNMHLPWYGDWRSVVEAALRFIDGGSPAVAASGSDAPAAGPNAFLRQGDVWAITFEKRTVHLKHSKGLADLALLLSRPGSDLEASELAQGNSPQRAHAAAGDPVLDRRALASYRTRLRELEERLDDSESHDDAEGYRRLEAERQALVDELRRATGLGGRTRKLGDEAERARKAVSGRIRQSIAAIRAVYPALGEHLESSVETGTLCSYSPAGSVSWQT